MATGSGNWTWDNETIEAAAGECNDSLANSTWLDEQMYTVQLVDRAVTPVWYLVGITGNFQPYNSHVCVIIYEIFYS